MCGKRNRKQPRTNGVRFETREQRIEFMRGIVWQRSTVVRAGMRNARHCASRYEYCMRRRRSGSARARMLEAWNGRAPSRTDHAHDGHVRARCVMVTDNVCLRTSGRAINDTPRRSQLTAARVVAHGSLHFMPPPCLEQTVRACPPAACLYGLIGTLHLRHASAQRASAPLPLPAAVQEPHPTRARR